MFLPCYLHLLQSQADIDFLWGGRDSGKSYFIACILIILCLKLPYFRCFLIKKSFNTIQESQWRTIKDICEAWGVDHLFVFKIAPLSIECINGNKFLARGCDDHQSIKSTKDPNFAWIEEGNQLSIEDFITITTTLRTNKSFVHQYFSFNQEFDTPNYEDHWLWKTFFHGKEFNGVYEWKLDLPDGSHLNYTYSSTHTTYKHNPHCSPQRIAFLEMLKDIDPYYYNIYTLGIPGRVVNNAPFAFAFNREKHLKPTFYNYQQETLLSFDFNKSPITCTVWQWYDNALHGLRSIKLPNSDIYALCDTIKELYPNALFVVTGDATGKATSALVQDNLNYYKVIKEKLDLSNGQLRVPTVNPPIKENKVLVNAVLAMVDVRIDPAEMKPLVYDLENVRVLPDGSIEKTNRNDPAQQADQLDTFRYLCNTFFKWVLKQ